MADHVSDETLRERMVRAERRSREAAQRADELRRRGEDLAGGERPDGADIDRARAAAQDAADHAETALSSAARAHAHSAELHREAADQLEAAGHPEAAAEHRRAGVADDEGAEQDARSAGGPASPRCTRPGRW